MMFNFNLFVVGPTGTTVVRVTEVVFGVLLVLLLIPVPKFLLERIESRHVPSRIIVLVDAVVSAHRRWQVSPETITRG